jgi:hypothetical protein
MAKRAHKISLSKPIATVLGAVLCGLEAWLNSEYFASLLPGGWWNPTVYLVAGATVGCAAALPFAERSRKAGQTCWAVCLALSFVFMAAVSLSITFSRLDDKRSGEVISARSGDERVKLAREAYDAAQKTAEAECGKRGPRCRAPEQAVAETNKALSAKPAERGEEGVTKQLGAAVTLYAFPLGQLLLGFALLGYGLSPKHREPVEPPKVQPKKTREPRKRHKSAVSQLGDGNVVPFKTRRR